MKHIAHRMKDERQRMADDREIVAAITENTEYGFLLLLTRYKEMLYWHIRRIVVSHEDAQDVTQETFVKAFRHFGQYDRANSLRAWLFRIATNEALRLLDRRCGRETVSIDKCDMTRQMVAGEYYDNADETVCRLQKAILSLPAKQQLAFNMRYYDNMPYREIALAIGSTEANVKANYYVAKEKIIKYMNDNG